MIQWNPGPYVHVPRYVIIFNWPEVLLKWFSDPSTNITRLCISQASSVLSMEEPSMASNCLPQDPLQFWLMPFPTPQYNINTFFATSGYLVSLVVAMGFLYPVSRLVKSIVEEKELRLKETMFILAVKPWEYFLSYCFTNSAVCNDCTISSVLWIK